MNTYNVDTRGLEPPEPMVRILDLARGLGDGETIVALMDREPYLLYPELERRGLEWDFEGDEDPYVLTIRQLSS